MTLEYTVVAFLVLIVATVSGIDCYVGQTYHGQSTKCEGYPGADKIVVSETCNFGSTYCGYYEASLDPSFGYGSDCVVVVGFCSSSASTLSCENNIPTQAKSQISGIDQIKKSDCCVGDDCNSEAISTPGVPSDFGAAVATYVIVAWVIGCICFWGICAGIITGIVCCVTRSRKQRAHLAKQHLNTTVTNTTRQQQVPVSVVAQPYPPVNHAPVVVGAIAAPVVVGATAAPVVAYSATAAPVTVAPVGYQATATPVTTAYAATAVAVPQVAVAYPTL